MMKIDKIQKGLTKTWKTTMTWKMTKLKSKYYDLAAIRIRGQKMKMLKTSALKRS